MKRSKKKQKEFLSKYDFTKSYVVDDAIKLIKEISKVKFDASFDIALRLGVDPRKAEQMIRGAVSLPNGTGKEVKILVLCTPEKESEAKAAGADYIGLDEYIKKIEGGWVDFDVMITMPSVMAKVGKLGKVLGPRGLMPNPKTGTVTENIENAIKDIKSGKIDFKVDKYGIIHASIGRISFTVEKLKENILELVNIIMKLKPSSAKGTYLKSVSISSTMSKGVFIEKSSLSVA
ncbi:MAG: 50S ribosomal protein L1 [Bacteroidetes bacterium]|nr:50S ribosomal protein L1 [Bacteroidota bacterium]